MKNKRIVKFYRSFCKVIRFICISVTFLSLPMLLVLMLLGVYEGDISLVLSACVSIWTSLEVNKNL